MTDSKTVTLTDLLTEPQIKEVIRICETTNDGQIVKTLTAYFKTFGEHLEQAKGVLPEYLAWVIYAKHKGVV